MLTKTTKWLCCALLVLCCLLDAAIAGTVDPSALPTGANVVSGSVSIVPSGAAMTITTNSQEAIIDWADFSVGSGATVTIAQPTARSMVLLRVTGGNPLQIDGSLQSNGQVFLVDTNGIVFDAASVVNAGGLVASTLDLPDANFLADQLQFDSGVGASGVANSGTITIATGGTVYLVGPGITEAGTINAPQGEILLASATTVDLTTPASPVVSDAVGAAASTITLSGQLLAQNGNIELYAGGAINVPGTMDAGAGGMVVVNTNAAAPGSIVLNNAGNYITGTGSFTLPGGGTLYVLAASGVAPWTGFTFDLPTSSVANSWVIVDTIGAINSFQSSPVLPSLASEYMNTIAQANQLQLTSSGTVYVINSGGILFGTTSILNPGTLTTASGVPADAASLGISSNMQVNTGWNFLGNSTDAPMNVATYLGNATEVISVWAWDAATGKWAFYAPAQTDGGAAYAATQGYELLTTINSGQGFWVNAATPFIFALPIGNLLPVPTYQTPPAPGWSMLSIGANTTPSQLNMALSATTPPTGTVPTNLTSLWAWDSAQSKWYFYAPNLEAQGGTALADYTAAKSYLDFTAASQTLGPGMGFWVNAP